MTGRHYRADIDGLRALAVGAVVAFHAFPNLVKGGFVGVDIFFVISGFLISGILFDSLARGTFSYADFYARRIRRIFPALIVVCAATWLAGWFVLLPDEFARLGLHVAAGAAFLSNIVLWSEAGYFDAAANAKPLLHLWSLGIEEQFYIVWPLVLAVFWQRKWGLLAATVTIAAISFAINIATVHDYPVSAFYLPFSRFWELMIGGILAFVVMHRPALIGRYVNWQSLIGVMLILVAVFGLNKDSVFPGFWALLPTVGTALIISAGPNAWPNKYIFGNRVAVGIGLISYPLYLWHWPLLVYPRIVKEWLLTPTERIGAVGAALILAYLTYRLIERPIRFGAVSSATKWLAGAMAGICVAGLIVAAGVLPSRLQAENLARILAAPYDREYPPVAAQSHVFGPLRYFVQPSQRNAFTLILGDSNSEQYAPRIDRAIKDDPATLNGAIYVGNQTVCNLLREILDGVPRCTSALNKLEGLLAEPTTTAIAIAASWVNFNDVLLDPANQDRLVQFLKTAAAGKTIYIVMNIPNGEELSPVNMFSGSRLTRLVPKPPAEIRFDFANFETRFATINRVLSDIAERTGATLIDPAAALCPNKMCPVFDGEGAPLYRDEGHLTRQYAIRSAVFIDAILKP